MNARTRQNVPETRMLRISELMIYLGMGKKSALSFARSAGAERTLGRIKVYDRKVIDQALDQLQE